MEKDKPKVQVTHRTISAKFLFLLTIFWFALFIVFIRQVQLQDVPYEEVWQLRCETHNDLTCPKSPPNAYWYTWMTKMHTFDRNVWFDVRGAHSKRTQKGGWKSVNSDKKAMGRKFKVQGENNLDNLLEDIVLSKPVPLDENADSLYFVNPKALYIYTRSYYYKDKDRNPAQTARLGIDYACPGQLYNHVPGASAFCRKDYMQMYLKAYQTKYKQAGNPQWYTHVTPKSYILTDNDACEEYLNELTQLLTENYGKELPLQFIHKNAVMHQGKGIQFIDYAKGSELLTKYQGPDRCAKLAVDHQNLIAQQYIHNPALIEKRKFDFRVFMVIANVNPLVVLWAPENGHIRLSDLEFDPTSSDFTAHVTANVHAETEQEAEFLLSYRGLNLRELGDHFIDKIGDTQEWLDNVVYPKIKNILIHMVRASQQNFVVKRPGLFELYGVDLIMEDNLSEIWLLESNRRPRVQEDNESIKYRKDGLLDDFTRIADYLYNTGVNQFKPDELYPHLEYLVPLIDETKEDPYFGMLSKECQNINIDLYDGKLPLDPMIEPLVHHLYKKPKMNNFNN